MKKKKIILLFTTFAVVLLILCINKRNSSLNFISEEVDILIEEDHSLTYGKYYFRNSSLFTKRSKLRFPIKSEDYSVRKVSYNNEEIKFEKYSHGIEFEIFSKPFSVNILVVEYDEYKNSEYEYVLTTTRSWQEPLEEAIFTVEFSDKVLFESCNYNFSQIEKNKMHFREYNFYPSNNLIIKYSINEE